MKKFYKEKKMNEVRITGKICNIKEAYTPSKKIVTSFGLNIYNGKDKDGNAKYDFLNCKCFEKIDVAPKSMVLVEGWLGVEEYKQKKAITIYAKSIQPQNAAKNPEVVETEDLDDDIPF